MSKIPSDGVLESLYKMRIREFDQLKTELELCDLEIHQKIPMPDYQKMKTMVKRSVDLILRLPNFDAKNGRIEAGAVVTNRRVNVVLKVDNANAINGKQEDNVREETSVVSGTMKITVQNPHQKPLHPLNHPHKEVGVHRGKRTSEAVVNMGRPIVSSAKTS